MRRHVYLVPGFFGFTRLGGLNYFEGVDRALAAALGKRGLDVEIYSCATRPTGSIRRRAAQLIDEIESRGGLDADELHLVGHSIGGLDLRLLLTPGVRLRPGDLEERLGARARSCVTVSTPHYGTPIANFFTTLPGRHLLEVLTLLATSSGGRYALWAASRALRMIARADDLIGLDTTLLDAWLRRALGNVTASADDPIWDFLRGVATDQGAIIQLTPESMDIFNAAVTDRDDVSYASVVTAAPPPPGSYRARDLLRPSGAALRGAFTLLHTVAGREHRHYPYPHPGAGVLAPHADALPFELSPRSNDGVVPAFSQLYGDVLGVVMADHLDIVGQFATDDPHSDWLPSGSGFSEARFRLSWELVADAIAEASA